MAMERKENPKKYHNAMFEIRHVYKCGHTVYIPEYLDRTLCNFCKHWVYKTPALEFRYKLKEKIYESRIS